MAADNLVIIPGVQLTTVIATYFDSTVNVNVRIVAFTVSNTTVGAVTYTVHIVPDGGVADATNMLIPAATLAAGESDVPLEMMNQLVGKGGSIQMLASANASISVYASAIEFT